MAPALRQAASAMTCCRKTASCRAPGMIKGRAGAAREVSQRQTPHGSFKIAALMLKEEIDDAPPEP